MRATRPSNTAQYVAMVRTVLTDQGVLDDPLAEGMLTPSRRAVATACGTRVLRWSTRSPFWAALATRIAWFDGEVRRAADDGIAQVVVVGAGYDSRAWRLARPGVRFFELDHPATQADKRRRAPAGGPTYVPADLARTSPSAALAGSGFDEGQRALFVLEGLVMYLAEADVRALLAALLTTGAPGSRLAVTFAARRGTDPWLKGVPMALLRTLGRLRGEPHRMLVGRTEAVALVAECGWRIDQGTSLHDVAPALLPGTHLPVDRISQDAAVVAATAERAE